MLIFRMNVQPRLPQGLALVVLDSSWVCVLQERNVSLTAYDSENFQGQFLLFSSKVNSRLPLAMGKKIAPLNENRSFAGFSMQQGGRWKRDCLVISFGKLIKVLRRIEVKSVCELALFPRLLLFLVSIV